MVRGTLLLAISCSLAACDAGPSDRNPNTPPWDRLSGRMAMLCSEDGNVVIDLLDADARTTARVLSSDRLSFPDGLSWSPGGDSLVFAAEDLPDGNPYAGVPKLAYQMAASARGHPSAVAPTETTSQYDPVWSSDGRIAWMESASLTGGYRVRVTGQSHWTTYHTGKDYAPFGSLAWSPDAASLLVTRTDSTSKSALYRLDLAAGALSPFVQGWGQDSTRSERFSHPAYSPDGNRLAFVRSGFDAHEFSAEFYEIWSAGPDGSERQRLTRQSIFQGELGDLSWSPDGTQIAFLRKSQPHVMLADGSSVERISAQRCWAIAWAGGQ